ncbi:NUDIX hydrolase, type 5 [Citrifermentans bemidjiense Bem]|uniref:NUDIX hydrolase, type 5 n=1 Tax=Citrifermentans bemidjiense (strain ATCC BAA-1014 / DSM 16622 / JCM 12645 / Bem) TaxID=404380 RepID=B5EIB9_CITBB|nr:NUDIX domain-containing protein [Citrifermentans bemidjiense]ACH39821.1 NUDIX hydrolase, type 5 [Citrifermentans bemidjiense Bem]
MKKSAGLVMYRFKDEQLELFLVHPGGPFWAGKDEGAWSIPKGEYLPGEDPFEVARREFLEETGLVAEGEFLELSEIRQPGGKKVKAWAFAGDCDPSAITSNTFSLEWPPRSGRFAEFPEVDRAGWFESGAARVKILKGQLPLIEELCLLINS